MKKQMSIGLVCPYNMAKGGGVQECVRALQRGLAAKGHQVKIITPVPRQKDFAHEEDVIYVGRARDIKSPFATVGQISVSLNTRTLEEVLEREKFDIIHFHEPWVPIVSRQILSRSSAKNVATFHAKLPDTMMAKTIEKVITPYTRSIMNYLDGFTAVSNAAAEYVASLSDEHITIIPNGIHIPKVKIPKVSSRDNSILYIGRLERRKGVKYLIRAFASLLSNSPETKLIIAGDGPDRAKLELLAAQLGVTKSVEFLGYISDEQKASLLKTSGVFCSPALYGESFGIVLLEAMVYGLPVVAGDNPGYSGVMRDFGATSIVNPKDELAFSRQLHLLLHDERMRNTWVDWATTYVQQYDYDVVVEAYEAYYRRLLQT